MSDKFPRYFSPKSLYHALFLFEISLSVGNRAVSWNPEARTLGAPLFSQTLWVGTNLSWQEVVTPNSLPILQTSVAIYRKTHPSLGGNLF